jgi:hypothetical protein
MLKVFKEDDFLIFSNYKESVKTFIVVDRWNSTVDYVIMIIIYPKLMKYISRE